MDVLDIAGVTDGLDNDYTAQAAGAIKALEEHDLVVIHIEAPDEAAHDGLIDEKIKAIKEIDRGVVGQLRSWKGAALRVLIMPDHPTPIAVRTHVPDPVPFLLWGPGFTANGAKRFTEDEAKGTGFSLDEGYNIMSRLVGKVEK
jgi:2,3-bisphosphoglycerate-independent phosphoglycerate mutase